MRTDSELHGAVLSRLAPVTRTRFTYVGSKRQADPINPKGLDLHDGHVGEVALDPAGRAEPYLYLMVHPTMDRAHSRLSGGASSAHFDFSLTVAAGSPAGVRWGLGLVRPLFRRARLFPDMSLLQPYLDRTDLLEDPDASPPRWYAPLRYRATVF